MSERSDTYSLSRLKTFRKVSATIFVLAGLSWISLANAEVYRYMKDGKVHYGDRAPTMGAANGHSVLNNQGMELKKVKSSEERLIQRQRDKEADARRIRDKTLLETFTEEEDLIRTRDERLGLVDDQIVRIDDRIRISKESLGSVDQRIKVAERSNGVGNAPASLYTEQSREKKRIENSWALIDMKAAERETIVETFQSDLDRYRWLKSGGVSNN